MPGGSIGWGGGHPNKKRRDFSLLLDTGKPGIFL